MAERWVRFIGDIHGRMDVYGKIVKQSPYPTIQVGDMGVGFVDIPDLGSQHRFIRGNHDNPHLCADYKNFIQDGTIEDNVMFIGGASSIDKNYRVPYFSWWPEEELSYYDLMGMMKRAVECEQPEVIVSHECPDFFADIMLDSLGRRKYPDDSRTRIMFDRLYESEDYRPRLHIFGHWHFDVDYWYKGTRFICLNEFSHIDINLDDIDGSYSQTIFSRHEHGAKIIRRYDE